MIPEGTQAVHYRAVQALQVSDRIHSYRLFLECKLPYQPHTECRVHLQKIPLSKRRHVQV